MQDVIFRMYDIRGKVGSELYIDQAYDLAHAIVAYMREKNPLLATLAVGMDGRTHSPVLKEEVCRALQDCGVQVIFLGICPSPVVYFALHTLPVDGGIVITASHNPKEYNGFKICLGKDALWGEDIQNIKRLYHEKKRATNLVLGTCQEYAIIPDYVKHLVSLFPHLVGMKLPIVFDCGNGATGVVIPELVKRLQLQAQVLYPDIDGNYPHHEADPVVEENMQDVKNVLTQTEAALGIGFDGDGDRMAAMTKKGFLIPGDTMLALLSKSYLMQHPGAAIVGDIKSSSSLLQAVEQWGGKVYLSPSGHSLVKKNMREYQAKIGGELSGHLFFYDRYFGYDDAVYAALRLLEMLQDGAVSLDELVAQLPHKVSSSEFRIACQEADKKKVIEAVKKALACRPDVSMITIDGIRVRMTQGLGILRASNTQPVLSLRFEADTEYDLNMVKTIFITAMEPYFDGVTLRKQLMI